MATTTLEPIAYAKNNIAPVTDYTPSGVLSPVFVIYQVALTHEIVVLDDHSVAADTFTTVRDLQRTTVPNINDSHISRHYTRDRCLPSLLNQTLLLVDNSHIFTNRLYSRTASTNHFRDFPNTQ